MLYCCSYFSSPLSYSSTLLFSPFLLSFLPRYLLLPSYASQIIGTMRAAVTQGLTNHRVSMKGVVEKCRWITGSTLNSLNISFRGHLEGSAEDTAYFKPFISCSSVVGEEAAEKLKKEAREAIQQGVRVGFKELADFLEQEYVPACRWGQKEYKL